MLSGLRSLDEPHRARVAPVRGVVSRSRLSDVDAVASAARCELSQLAPGGEAEMTGLRLGSGSLQTIRSTFSLVTHGDRPSDVVTFVRPSRTRGLTMNGRAPQPSRIWLYAPGAEVHGVLPPRSSLTLLALPRERLDGPTYGSFEGLGVEGFRELRPPASVVSAIERIVDGALELAEGDPAALQEEDRRRHIEDDLVEQLCLAVRVDTADPLPPVSRSQLLRVVEAVLSARRDEPVRLTDLCAACGVSERTLRNAFYQAYDMSPMRFLRLRRLNGARRALLRADAEGTTVERVALRWGFWHPGAFSVAYRGTFGEKPSETLRRSR